MFKPMLADNKQPNLETLKFPQFVSKKMDGVRIIFYKGKILSRSLKEIPNKQLKEKFEPIRKITEKYQIILDGEGYSPKLTFQQIIHFTMTEDLGKDKIPEHLQFYCFDYIEREEFNTPFEIRIKNLNSVLWNLPDIFQIVEQKLVNNKKEVESYFEEVLKEGYEGLILKNLQGKYKCGRTTAKENLMYKVKPFISFDAKITSIVQSTEVNEEAEKKTNELGRSVTSKKKDDRHLIEKASAFWVEYEGKPLKVVLAMTDKEKEEVWKNKDSYIGRMIEYKGMQVGAKDVPRHPVMLRFRDDK